MNELTTTSYSEKYCGFNHNMVSYNFGPHPIYFVKDDNKIWFKSFNVVLALDAFEHVSEHYILENVHNRVFLYNSIFNTIDKFTTINRDGVVYLANKISKSKENTSKCEQFVKWINKWHEYM